MKTSLELSIMEMYLEQLYQSEIITLSQLKEIKSNMLPYFYDITKQS